MEFRTLGPLVVLDDNGETVGIERPVRRRLLSVLLLSADRAVPYVSLERAAWGDEPPATARRTMQAHLSRLRTLGPEIRRVGDGYRLCVSRGAVDAHRFRSVCERMASATAEELGEALGWWRGEPWVDLAETFRPVEQAQLEEYRMAVEERLVLLRLRAGEQAVAAVEAERLTGHAPERERRWVLWALSLYGEQRRREAFDVLDRARRSLGEFGLVPGALLERVETALVQDRPVTEAVALLDVSSGPTSRVDGSPRGDVAAQRLAVNRIIGREREARLLGDLLDRQRLVSITGTGGVGKTRLAVEVMERCAPRFSGNAWFCELAPLGNPGAVAHSVASTLNVTADAGGPATDAVGRFLRRQSGVLVLDNCEHVREAAADLIDALLETPGDFVILTTSREPLGLDGEHVVPLAPLDPTSEDAVGLFVDRARAVLGEWEPTEAELDDVRAICVALDGIPLGMELAAARLRSMSTTEVRHHLERSFSLLRTSTRRAARHRTLDATTEWSYQLLDNAERAVFSQLSVFAGGFTGADAEDVVGHDGHEHRVVDVLDGLVAKALIEVSDRTHRTRYRILEPIRQFAAAKLLDSGSSRETRDRHAEHFAQREAARSQSVVRTVDFDNLRVALDWLIQQHETELALRLVHGVGAAAVTQDLLEVREWCVRVIDLPGASEHPLAPEVAGVGAALSCSQGRFEDAWRLVHAAEAMPAYRPDRYFPAYVHARLCWSCGGDEGDVDEALALLDGIDVSSPTAKIGVNWHRVVFRPDGPQADDALDELREFADGYGDQFPVIRSWYLAAKAHKAIAAGSSAEAIAATDALWQHAATHGTDFDRYLAIGARAGAAVLSGRIDVALLEALVSGMRVRLGRGPGNNRNNLLRHASNLLWQLGEDHEAALIRASFSLAPFHGALDHLDDPCLLEAAQAREDEARTLDLDELTERAIAAIERVLVHMDSRSDERPLLR